MHRTSSNFCCQDARWKTALLLLILLLCCLCNCPIQNSTIVNRVNPWMLWLLQRPWNFEHQMFPEINHKILIYINCIYFAITSKLTFSFFFDISLHSGLDVPRPMPGRGEKIMHSVHLAVWSYFRKKFRHMLKKGPGQSSN